MMFLEGPADGLEIPVSEREMQYGFVYAWVPPEPVSLNPSPYSRVERHLYDYVAEKQAMIWVSYMG